MRQRLYKIVVLTLQGQPLTYHVTSYDVIKGDFVSFIDTKTKILKLFHASRCEITEIGGGSA